MSRPIILNGQNYGSVEIRIVNGPWPYMGVAVHDPRLSAPENWHYLDDKDLWRLDRMVKKCMAARKKRKAK